MEMSFHIHTYFVRLPTSQIGFEPGGGRVHGKASSSAMPTAEEGGFTEWYPASVSSALRAAASAMPSMSVSAVAIAERRMVGARLIRE